MERKTIFSSLNRDIPASIVVLFVALPLCLGIALASGAPLFSGLISGIIGGKEEYTHEKKKGRHEKQRGIRNKQKL